MIDRPTGVASSIAARFVAAWDSKDATRFAELFHHDADFTNVFGAHARGREAIAAMHAPIFASVFKDSVLEAGEPAARAVRDDVVAVDLPWTMRGHRGPDGAALPERRGLLTFVLTREDGGWGILISHNTDLTENAEALAFRRDASVSIGER
jgi:uncharacterized protein (TIGR02246 family)